MSLIRSASLALILSTSLTLGACSPKDKGKSATKSAAAKMLGLTAPGDDVFARHFDVQERSVSESEAEQALAALGLLNPSDDALNWAAKSGAEGNYTYNNLTVDSGEGDITISSAKLFGAHMDGEVATFDRADFEGIKIYDEDEDVTVTLDALSVARPSPAMAKSIVASLSQLSELNDFDNADMSFGALALNKVTIKSPEANGEISNLVWGTDAQTNLTDMKLEDVTFNIAPENKKGSAKVKLGSLIATELRTDLYTKFLDGAKANANPLAGYGLWGKSFDTVKLDTLDIDADSFSVKTKGFEGKATQKGQVTTIIQASQPISVKLKEPSEAGASFQEKQAYQTFADLGFDEMVLQTSQTSIMDASKDLMSVKEGLVTLKDGFELSYNYEAGGANKAAKAIDAAAKSGGKDVTLEALQAITLNGVELRLEDNSIIERALELAGKMQGSSAGAMRTQAKLGLRLAPLAAQGVEGEILGELAGALSEFIDGGKTLSIVMSPKAPLPVSSLTELKDGSVSFKDLGFSAKTE